MSMVTICRLGKAFWQTEGWVTGVRPDFQNLLGSDHLADQRKQPPLQLAAQHARHQHMGMRVAIDGFQ